MHQKTLKLLLKADTSSVTEDIELNGKQTVQVQLYQDSVNDENRFQVAITDLSDIPLLPKQPIQNLRSRDGGYDNNCPFVVKKDKVRVVISSNAAASVDTEFTLVVDVEGDLNC